MKERQKKKIKKQNNNKFQILFGTFNFRTQIICKYFLKKENACQILSILYYISSFILTYKYGHYLNVYVFTTSIYILILSFFEKKKFLSLANYIKPNAQRQNIFFFFKKRKHMCFSKAKYCTHYKYTTYFAIYNLRTTILKKVKGILKNRSITQLLIHFISHSEYSII